MRNLIPKLIFLAISTLFVASFVTVLLATTYHCSHEIDPGPTGTINSGSYVVQCSWCLQAMASAGSPSYASVYGNDSFTKSGVSIAYLEGNASKLITSTDCVNADSVIAFDSVVKNLSSGSYTHNCYMSWTVTHGSNNDRKTEYLQVR